MKKFLKETRKLFVLFLVLAITFTSYDLSMFSQKVKAATTSTTTTTATTSSTDANVIYASESNRNDFRDETIYFVMTTRFYDGDSSNNVQCWDGQTLNANDPAWRGDFKGLIDKLDYIKALGFTAIWITPVVENASGYDYHGYHALNFSEVDKRYESDDCTYQDLINAVHAKGMKIIQDVVFNHTGNFGEENIAPMFTKDETGDLGSVSVMKKITDKLPSNYDTLTPAAQYQARLALLKNTDGVNHDIDNIYHHWGMFNWESYEVQLGQIAGDCVDLNTENPKVYKYIQKAYDQYIKMGVDAFRVDTTKHISRLTFNNAFNKHFNDTYNSVHGTTGANNFYMFGEVCTRYRSVWNDSKPGISTPFYTWKDFKTYAWNDNENDANAPIENEAQAKQNYNDQTIANQPTSTNAFLNGNTYHTPDYSMKSGLDVIDFPMHWAFAHATDAFNTAKGGDQYYNDATYNVVYVDSHDYAPDTAPENQRFAQPQDTWAENLSLMFTFRGIPCLYYGSEIEFQKGKVIDNGPNTALAETGRAYFGSNIEGSVDVTDFATYTNATGKMAETLNHPLALHIQRLNRLRAAVPALRKGQYSTDGCSGELSFKRRYTDATTDSYALVTVSSSSTFTGVLNGTYVDCITGDTKVVTNGTLTATCNKKGDLRVYVLNTDKTPAPGMIMGTGSYLSGGGPIIVNPVNVTAITLSPSSSSLDIGDTVTLSSTIAPSNATNKTLTWTSSNTSVATVSGGKVTANAIGTATITATSSNGVKATATITVTATGVQVSTVTFDKTTASMDIGTNLTLSATVLPTDAKNKTLTWSSSNTSVATVNNGIVTAVKAGTATITATSVNGKTASATITVKGLTYESGYMYFEKPSTWGDSVKAYIWSDDKTYINAAWPGVAATKLSDGTYSIKYPEGKTNLNVIFNDGSNQTADLKAINNGYYTVSGYDHTIVTETIPVTNVSLVQTSATLNVSESVTLTSTVLPSNATDKTLTWTTSNSAVATVANGVVTGVGAGTATITATSVNGISATSTITVNKQTIQSGYMYFEKPSTWGSTVNAYIWSDDGTYKNAAWPGVATTKMSDGTYAIKYPEGKTNLNIIFNDGSKQTADLDAIVNGYYTVNGYDHTVITETIPVTSVSLVQTSATLNVGDTLTLTSTVLPSNATDKTLTWTTSNSAVATVTNGVVKGIAAGSATITAKSSNGLNATATITVNASTIGYMYFVKPSTWGSTIYAYMWTDDGTYKNAAWPGVATTKMSDGTYAIVYPEGKTGLNVIFTDGSKQTADLDAVKGKTYTVN